MAGTTVGTRTTFYDNFGAITAFTISVDRIPSNVLVASIRCATREVKRTIDEVVRSAHTVYETN